MRLGLGKLLRRIRIPRKIAIVLVIVAAIVLVVGILNVMKLHVRVPIAGIEDATKIHVYYVNVSKECKYDEGIGQTICWYEYQLYRYSYNVSDVATIYGDMLAIVPPSVNDTYTYYIFIELDKSWKDVIERGMAKIAINATYTGCSGRVPGSPTLEICLTDVAAVDPTTLRPICKIVVYRYSYEQNLSIDTDLDPLSSVIHSSDKPIYLAIPFPYKQGELDIQFQLYTVSDKPILRVLVEPIYSAFSGLWTALVSLMRRFRRWLASAFGGFSLSAILSVFTDPVTAMVTVIAIATTIAFLIRKNRKR